MVAGHVASMAWLGVRVTPEVESLSFTSRVNIRVGQHRRVTLNRSAGCLIDEVAVLEAGQVKLHLSSLRVHVARVTRPSK